MDKSPCCLATYILVMKEYLQIAAKCCIERNGDDRGPGVGGALLGDEAIRMRSTEEKKGR